MYNWIHTICFHLPNHPNHSKIDKRVNKLNFTYSRIVDEGNERNVIAVVSPRST